MDARFFSNENSPLTLLFESPTKSILSCRRPRLTRFRGARLGLSFRIGLFHRFTRFFGALGADFGALLALFVEHLLAAEQLDEGFLRAIAFTPCGAHDA